MRLSASTYGGRILVASKAEHELTLHALTLILPVPVDLFVIRSAVHLRT